MLLFLPEQHLCSTKAQHTLLLALIAARRTHAVLLAIPRVWTVSLLGMSPPC